MQSDLDKEWDDVMFGAFPYEADAKTAKAHYEEGLRLKKKGRTMKAQTKMWLAYLYGLGHAGREKKYYDAFASCISFNTGDTSWGGRTDEWNPYPSQYKKRKGAK